MQTPSSHEGAMRYVQHATHGGPARAHRDVPLRIEARAVATILTFRKVLAKLLGAPPVQLGEQRTGPWAQGAKIWLAQALY